MSYPDSVAYTMYVYKNLHMYIFAAESENLL